MSAALDTRHIQSLVFSGHGRHVHSLVVGLEVEDLTAVRISSLRLVDQEISFGLSSGQRTKALQFMVSAPGLVALGVDAARWANLDTAFLEGIVGPQRSRALGDVGSNDPGGWRWNDRQVHAMAIFYGAEAEEVDQESKRLFSSGSGWKVIFEQAMCSPPDRREPFGFRDGISVPRINVSGGDAPPDGPELIAPGEIVLGRRTAADTEIATPALGIDGAYLVVRQVEQHVQEFWSFWRSQAKNDEGAVWLASKAFGRWPNGMPMEAQSPGAPPPADEKKVQAPLRFASDVRGRRCPFGAHIRRANPRDSLDDSPEVSLRLVANHRIIRRGRMYGPAAPAFWYPAGVEVPRLDSGDKPASDERGIVFVALCSDLTRQFEFIQQTWMNNPKFLDLNDESDPIAAGTNIVSNDGHFTVPGDPVRRRIPGLPLFTTIRAGGYFLMPGREALDLIFRPN